VQYKRLVPIVLVCLALAFGSMAWAQEAPADEPGLDAGTPAPGFSVAVVSGPEAIVGQEMDFVKHEGYDPLVLLFVTERNDDVDAIITKLNEWASVKNGDQETGFHAVVVFVGEFKADEIKAWAQEKEIVIPMGLATDPAAVTEKYDIADETAALLQVFASDDTLKKGLTDFANIDDFLASLSAAAEQPAADGGADAPAEGEA
jgi:hypothetical protein